MRNDPEINPHFLQALAEAEEHGRQAREEVDRLLGKPPQTTAEDFEEKIDTAVRRLEAAERAIVDAAREKMPSASEIHNHFTVPVVSAKPPSSAPPSKTSRVAIELPAGIKFRGSGTVVAVLAVVFAGIAGLVWVLAH